MERTILTPEYKRYLENLAKKGDYNRLVVEGYYWNIFNYVSDKSGEAAKKAWKTGNLWDYWDTTMFHIYGYGNLNKIWGGENIKWLLDTFLGLDEKGNVSVGNLLIDIIAILPWPVLSHGVVKMWLKVVPNVVKNNNVYRNY